MKHIALAAALLLSTAACASSSSVNIALPDSFLANAERVPLHRSAWTQSKSPLTLGDYRVVAFHDAKKTHVKSSSIVPIYLPDPTESTVNNSSTKQSLYFHFNQADQILWDADCQARSRGEGFTIRGTGGEVRRNGDMVCTFAQGDAQWSMALWQYGDLSKGWTHSVEGQLTDPNGRRWQIEPVYTILGREGHTLTLPEPVGFSLKDGDEVVAAVDTLAGNNGTILFSKSLDAQQRSVAAASLAAVVLHLEDRGGRVIHDLW